MSKSDRYTLTEQDQAATLAFIRRHVWSYTHEVMIWRGPSPVACSPTIITTEAHLWISAVTPVQADKGTKFEDSPDHLHIESTIPKPDGQEDVGRPVLELSVTGHDVSKGWVGGNDAPEVAEAMPPATPVSTDEREPTQDVISPASHEVRPIASSFDPTKAAREARAKTVAKLIDELGILKPQMIDDEAEYNRLRSLHPSFLSFQIADRRSDLKQKVLSIRYSTRHIRLAQELAAAHCSRHLSTIQDDWKDHKPTSFRRPR